MQKNLIVAFVSLLLAGAAQNKLAAQIANLGIQGTESIGANSPDSTAILDITSTAKGILIPRMTNAQKTAIVKPATGLLVFQTDGSKGFYYFDGSLWQAVTGGGGAGGGWSLTGNSGTNPSTNFIGTIDAQPLNLRVNNLRAGYVDLAASGNSGLGLQALGTLTTGTFNTGVGFNALYNNKSGYNNTAIGAATLYSVTNGHDLVGIGDSALYLSKSANNNTAVGSKALVSNFSGGDNTGIGFKAMYANNTGDQNTAIGSAALSFNATGSLSTAVGFKALSSSTSASNNTATGGYSLYYDSSGYNNTAFGLRAGFRITSGYKNSALGDSALGQNSTGTFNTAVGSRSLYGNKTGSNNTAIGAAADFTATNLTNGTAIGYQASVTASNQVRVGNAAVTSIGGFVNWSNISDGRFKKNIKPNVQGLAFIKKLQPVTYTLDITGINNFINNGSRENTSSDNPEAFNAAGNRLGGATDIQNAVAAKETVVYSGFIAQDVEKTAKDLGYNFSGIDAPKSKTDLYGLRYSDFVVPLVKAVQELSSQNDSIQANNKQLQKENRDLKNTVNNIQNQLTGILQQLEDLKAAQEACCFNSLNSQQGGNSDAAKLEQNAPNPFNNNTLIRYYLPVNTQKAQIVVTNVSGQVLKSVALSGAGTGQIVIHAGELSSGNYFYTLIVDGKKIATKQMVLLQ